MMLPLDDRTIILLVGGGILLLNIGIIYAFMTGSAQQQLNIVRRIFSRARSPWADENESLNDLRQRVERLNPDEPTDEQAD